MYTIVPTFQVFIQISSAVAKMSGNKHSTLTFSNFQIYNISVKVEENSVNKQKIKMNLALCNRSDD